MPTIARTIVALTLAALVLAGCAPMAAAPAAPAVSESLWVACVESAYAAGDPSDGTLGACDARYGDMWRLP